MKKADAYASAFFITKYYIFYRGRICNSVGIHVESIVSTSHLIRMFKLNIKQLNALAQLADELLLDTNREEELVELLNVHLQTSFTFENDTCKGYFYYILGNCSSGLYKYRDQDWYSKNLIDTVNLYQKSVHFLRNETKNIGLLSDALTNLGNFLSSQGRGFCAQYYWDKAIDINRNPVALVDLFHKSFFTQF